MSRHSSMLALPLALLILSTGCATHPLVGVPPPPPPADSARVPPDAPARAPGAAREPGPAGSSAPGRPAPGGAEPPADPAIPPAAAALLEQSRGQRASGAYAAAASSIERALRIDPGNAELWLELGEIKLADDDPQQAEQMARKALTIAGGDRAVTARAERLLSRAATCSSGGC